MSFSDSLFARLLRGLARAVCRRPQWFIYPQLILAVLCTLYTAFGLKMDMNRDHLIGPQLRSHQIFLQFQKEFPGEDELVVVVESGNAEHNRQFVERLAAKVRPQTNFFTDLFYKADLTTLGPKALLLSPTKDLLDLRRSLQEYLPVIQQFTQATNLNSLFELINREFRTAPQSQNSQTEALVNALPLLQRIIVQAGMCLLRPGTPPSPGVEGLLGAGKEAEQQIYITLDQGRMYLLTVRPRNEALTEQAIERLRQALGQVRLEVPGVDAGLTGGPVLDYDEMKQSEHDSIRASFAALIICSMIFIIAYRQVRRPLKAALCLLIGMGYTMGFTTLVVGHLNILTITFAPMLIGLAVDFGIHFITRYEEEMRNRRTADESIYRSMVFTGQGIVTGGLTTAAAFLAMAFTNFRGIREMGLISGAGLLLCLVPMMTTLPALLLHGPQNHRDWEMGPAGQRRLKIERLWLQRPWAVLGTTLVLCAGSAWAFGKIYFDYDLLHMQSAGLASVRYEEKLIRAGGRSVIFAAVIADSAQQARLYEQRLKALPSVADVQSVADFFGPDEHQKLQIVSGIKRELAPVRFAPSDPHPVRLPNLSATLWYLAGYLGLAADQAAHESPGLAQELTKLRDSIAGFRRLMLSGQGQAVTRLTEFQQAFFGDLHHTFAALKSQDTSTPLRPQDLAPALRDRFIGVHGKYLLHVYPKKDMWQHDNQREFISELQSAVPPNRVTGTPVQLYEYTTLLKVSYEQAAYYSLATIVVMLFLHFQSLVAVILALLPVAIGSSWLLGLMGTVGLPFNPANIMTLPLVVGIGVTNGIQILNRFAEEQSPRVLAKSTGKAVLVSGLTALAGFGTLLMARHLGIRSLGEVMSVGIAACMAAALTFLPAVLCLLIRYGWTVRLRAEVPAPGRTA